MQLKEKQMWSDGLFPSCGEMDDAKLRFACFGSDDGGDSGSEEGPDHPGLSDTSRDAAEASRAAADFSGDIDDAPATPADFGPMSGFGLSPEQAAIEANAANAAFGGMTSNDFSGLESAYRDQQSLGSKFAGLFGGKTSIDFSPTGFKANTSYSPMSVATSPAASLLARSVLGPAGTLGMTALKGYNYATSPTVEDYTRDYSKDPSTNKRPGPDTSGDGGYDDDGYIRTAQQPSVAPVLSPALPTYTPAPRPQYEYKRNWWEGNKFFPAPITRIN